MTSCCPLCSELTKFCHQGTRKLYIFGGTRKRDELLNDFFSYAVDTGEAEIISSINGPSVGPAGETPVGSALGATMPSLGHTQRATIDIERNEIHVMTVRNIFDSEVVSKF